VFPVLFLLTVAGPSAEGGTFGMAIVLLGVIWIGLGIAHACCCASCPTAAASSPAVLAGTFVGDTGAYFGGRALGRRRMAPRHLAEQDRRGPGLRILTAVLTVWIVNLYQDWIDTARRSSSARGRARRAAGRPVRVVHQARRRHEGHRRLFGAHGGALDRLDAVLWSLVVGYWIWRALL
jgi:phosphatidate cytidylyltransferase